MEPTIPQSPFDEEGADAKLAPRRSGESSYPPRNHSPLFPPADETQETIRKTLTRPLMSEGYETEHTARSSEYFTPQSPSVVLRSPSGATKPLEDRMRPSKSGDSFTSGSFYSDDGEDHRDEEDEGGDEVRPMRESRIESASYRGPRGTFVPPSPTVPTDDSRPSNESGKARRSQESSGRSSGHPRPSMADSHISVYSTSFGPITGRSRHTRSSARSERPSEDVGSSRSFPKSVNSDDMIQPPPSSLLATSSLPSTGSEVGLHSFGGVGEIQLANTPGPSPRPSRSSTAPQPSSLASRRSQHLRPLDLLSVSSLGPSMGVRSAPPVERDSMGAGSFLDFDLPLSATGWKDGDWAPEEPPLEEEEDALVYVETASNSRSRVPSNAATIVPSPMKGIFAAAGASGSSIHAAPEPVVMRFPNTSNPYLQNPYSDIDPTRPLTNTPSATTQSGGFISTTLSTLSSLNLLSRKDSLPKKGSKKKRADIPFDLKRYAQDPRARSTPTLSPSAKVFADVAPGRHSNVSGSRGRFGHGFMDIEPSESRAQWVSPEQRKLDGLVAQHLQAERDLLKKVAKGVGKPDHQ